MFITVEISQNTPEYLAWKLVKDAKGIVANEIASDNASERIRRVVEKLESLRKIVEVVDKLAEVCATLGLLNVLNNYLERIQLNPCADIAWHVCSSLYKVYIVFFIYIFLMISLGVEDSMSNRS